MSWRDVYARDIFAMTGRRFPPSMAAMIMHPEFAVIRRLRRAESLRNRRDPLGKLLYAVARTMYSRLALRYGIDIPLGVFGAGLSIAHVGTMTVNGAARVGEMCRIHPGVTLGGDASGAPSIGDNVFIGPNAIVIGGVTIGDNVVIGPGALVTRDVPPAHLVTATRGETRARAKPAWPFPGSGLGPLQT